MKKKISQLIAGTTVAAVATLGAAVPAIAAPGPGNIDPDATSSLTIHKRVGVAGTPNDGTELVTAPGEPLNGVTFSLQQVTNLDVLDPTDWPTISALEVSPTGQITGPDGFTANLSTAQTQVTAGTGDSAGTATFGPNLTKGVYLVTETSAPNGVVEKAAPFFITIPLPKAADQSWIYNVHVYPKNMVTSVEKEVTDPGSVGIGSAVTWTLKGEVPVSNAAAHTHIAFRDTLDSRLAYVADSARGYSVTEAGVSTEIPITVTNSGQVYTFSVTAPQSFPEGTLFQVEFSTQVTSLGSTGVIENKTLFTMNDPSFSSAVESDPVETQWGAVEILKHDSKGNKALSGAEFRVFATQAQANTCLDAVKANSGVSAACTGVTVTRDQEGTSIPAKSVFATDETGTVLVPGLNVGTNQSTKDYWLVETKAPAGYILKDEAILVTVTPNSTATAVEVSVPNTQEPPHQMPDTGANGAKVLALIGGALLIAGGIALAVSRRSKKQSEEA